MLLKNEFDVLRFIAENDEKINQRMIANEIHISLGTANSIIASLVEKGLINSEYKLTVNGKKSLEPYRVKNALILAAGMSTRFVPISYEIPKGLLSVKGEVLIERLIRQLRESGVDEIVIVVGYMLEKFLYLQEKYGVNIVVNSEFSSKNTHSSVYYARQYVSNTYICCSDNYYPENMFHKYEYRAFYCSVYLPGTSYVERGFTVDKNYLIIDTQKPSKDQWIMYGHAYFDNEFSEAFIPILCSYFGKEGVENMYWETIYAENVKKLPMWIQKCNQEQILEFDCMDELKEFDPDYLSNNRVEVIDNICKTFNCDAGDIKEISEIKKGLNNRSFKFLINDTNYVYRHPGVNASNVIDRKKEAVSLNIAKKLGVDDTLVYVDDNNGWKISKYIDVTDTFDFGNHRHIEMLAKKLKVLHDSNSSVGFSFIYEDEADKLIERERSIDKSSFLLLNDAREKMKPVFEYLKKNKWRVSLCHNDIYEPNILVCGNNIELIDWEFAGDADIGFDICKLFSLQNPSYAEIDDWTFCYFGRNTTDEEKFHLISCAAVIYYYWYIWGIYAQKNSNGVSEYIISWYKRMNYYRNMFNERYNGE